MDNNNDEELHEIKFIQCSYGRYLDRMQKEGQITEQDDNVQNDDEE